MRAAVSGESVKLSYLFALIQKSQRPGTSRCRGNQKIIKKNRFPVASWESGSSLRRMDNQTILSFRIILQMIGQRKAECLC